MSARNQNIARAERANEALQAYEPKCPKACLSGEVLIDLLCDLMHWARENGEDFAKECESAKASFEAEVVEEQNEDDAKHGEVGEEAAGQGGE
jgi:hypothetical protein